MNDKLKALARKWRDEASELCGSVEECADELDALAATLTPLGDKDREAVAYRLMMPDGTPCPAFGKWVEAGYWESSPIIKPVLRDGAYYEFAYAAPIAARLSEQGAQSEEPNRPIGELLAEYDMQGWAAADCIGPAKRYVSTMPDSQVRCLLHILAEAPPAAAVESGLRDAITKLHGLYSTDDHSDEFPDDFNDGYEQACAEFRQHLAAILTTPIAGVSDEKVEAALNAFYGTWPWSESDPRRAWMRAALAAAEGVK